MADTFSRAHLPLSNVTLFWGGGSGCKHGTTFVTSLDSMMPKCTLLTRVILDKWPEDKGDVPIAAMPYFTIWDELSIQNGIVFCGETLLHGVRSGIILCRERAAILKSLPLMTKHLLVQDVTLRQHQKIVATTQCQAKCYNKRLVISLHWSLETLTEWISHLTA